MYIGVEIGATKMQVMAVTSGGVIHETMSHAVDIAKGAGGILSWISEAIRELQTRFPDKIEAIGVGFGGIISRAKGSTLLSVQVHGWEDFPLRRFFEDTFQVPCIVENDTVCGGYAEYLLGSGRGTSDFFYTNIGSGIGGALFVQGQLVSGQDLGCAYFGHTWVPSWTKADEPAKVENLCSGLATERRLNQAGYVPPTSSVISLAKGSPVTCKHLRQAAEAGDAFALMEIDHMAKSFGIGLANVLTFLHPERIAIGGGLSHFGDLLLDPIRRYAAEYAFEPCKKGFEIVQCTYIEQAVPLGAALLASNRKEISS